MQSQKELFMCIGWKKWMNKHPFQQCESGQSIIETAFLITFVLLLILAFVSVSSAYYYRTNLHHMTSNVGRVLSLSEIPMVIRELWPDEIIIMKTTASIGGSRT